MNDEKPSKTDLWAKLTALAAAAGAVANVLKEMGFLTEWGNRLRATGPGGDLIARLLATAWSIAWPAIVGSVVFVLLSRRAKKHEATLHDTSLNVAVLLGDQGSKLSTMASNLEASRIEATNQWHALTIASEAGNEQIAGLEGRLSEQSRSLDALQREVATARKIADQAAFDGGRATNDLAALREAIQDALGPERVAFLMQKIAPTIRDGEWAKVDLLDRTAVKLGEEWGHMEVQWSGGGTPMYWRPRR